MEIKPLFTGYNNDSDDELAVPGTHTGLLLLH